MEKNNTPRAPRPGSSSRPVRKSASRELYEMANTAELSRTLITATLPPKKQASVQEPEQQASKPILSVMPPPKRQEPKHVSAPRPQNVGNDVPAKTPQIKRQPEAVPRSATQQRPMTQQRPVTQQRPAPRQRPVTQQRPAPQQGPTAQQRPVTQQRPAAQQRPAVQQIRNTDAEILIPMPPAKAPAVRQQAPSAKAPTASRVQTVKNSGSPQSVVASQRPAAQRPAVQKPARQQSEVRSPEGSPRPVQRNTANRPSPERIISPEVQRKRETVSAYGSHKGGTFAVKLASFLGKAVALLLIFAVFLVGTVFVCLKMICGDTSPAAKELLVTTLLETGQMKGVASLFLSAEEIQAIVDGNAMESFEENVDTSLIQIDKEQVTEDGTEQKDIEVVEISGRNFFGTMLIIKDPSRVELSTIYPWADEGVPLDTLVKDAGAVAGINGGLYNSGNNSGGRPYGVVVAGGEIQYNEPQQFPGFVLIGFTEDHILEIIPIDGYSKQDVIDLVEEKKIRDAVTFQEEASDKNNHFVQLVINGEARDMNGMGSGLNPRTAIGQRADGSVLMLVTDGRGKAGHLGASASDLINIMVEYGAVNAANLDGGSSSCMYYDNEYLMTSVTFYYSNSSWNLPLAFVVK